MSGNNRIRIVDIAQRAQVSRAAAACVLLGTGAGCIRVSKAKTSLIRQLALEMNFQPDLSAQMLAGKQSKIIGVLIDSYAPQVRFQTLSVAEELLACSGYRFIIGQTHRNLANYQSYIRDFVSRRVEAMICFSHEYSDFDISTEFSDWRKVIFLNRPQLLKSHYVDVDIVTGIESIVGHLYERGRRRIGLWLSRNSGLSGQRREQGYLRGLTLHGLDYDPGFVHRTGGFQPDRNECDAAIEHFVRVMKADAIIAQNDLWGIKLLKGLSQTGVHVPSDIAVTGVDNRDFSQFTHPSLTTLDPDCRSQGEQITAMMQRILVDEKICEPQHVVISPKLIIREST